MNYPTINGNQVRNDGCGRLAMQTAERAFWQSRMTRAGRRASPPELVDLRQLASDVRRAHMAGS